MLPFADEEIGDGFEDLGVSLRFIRVVECCVISLTPLLLILWLALVTSSSAAVSADRKGNLLGSEESPELSPDAELASMTSASSSHSIFFTKEREEERRILSLGPDFYSSQQHQSINQFIYLSQRKEKRGKSL